MFSAALYHTFLPLERKRIQLMILLGSSLSVKWGIGYMYSRLQGEKIIFQFFSLVTPHYESAIRTEFFATPVQGKERWVRKSEIFCCNSKSHFCIETNGAENGPEAAESFT